MPRSCCLSWLSGKRYRRPDLTGRHVQGDVEHLAPIQDVSEREDLTDGVGNPRADLPLLAINLDHGHRPRQPRARVRRRSSYLHEPHLSRPRIIWRPQAQTSNTWVETPRSADPSVVPRPDAPSACLSGGHRSRSGRRRGQASPSVLRFNASHQQSPTFTPCSSTNMPPSSQLGQATGCGGLGFFTTPMPRCTP